MKLSLAFGIIALPAWGGIIAQVADGGGWQTDIVCVSSVDTQRRVDIEFYTGKAAPWDLGYEGAEWKASRIYLMVPPNGMRGIRTSGLLPSTTSGYARVFTGTAFPSIGCSAIFRRSAGGGLPASEGTSPERGSESRVIFPFDNRGALATGIALVNPADRRQSVIVRMRDYEGDLIELTGFDMQPGEHMAFSVAARFPKTANQIGTIEFKIDSNTVGGVLTGLGLRFSPTGSFTSIEPLMAR